MGPVQFTPGQLREAVGISVETFRHWKRVLPTFAKRKPYLPSFTMGDLVAGGILRHLTEQCGIRIGHLTKISSDIVRVCNVAPWASLEHQILLIDFSEQVCRLVSRREEIGSSAFVLRCPLQPVLREVREGLLRSIPSANQHSLHFPPVRVERERHVRRSVP